MNKLPLSLVLLAAQCQYLQALNLTPNPIAFEGQGTSITNYFFEDNGKRLSFLVAANTRVTGNNDAVAFRFDDLPRATMKISRSQISPRIPFDEKSLPTYRDIARAILGSDVQNVQVEELPNPISINRWTSHQFTFTYDQFGQHLRRSVTFLNFSESEQLVIDISSSSEDYAKSYTLAYRVLNSLTDVPFAKDGPT